MRYIDKDKYRDEGNVLVDAYLDKCWNVEERRYSNIRYDAFQRENREALTKLFLRNQSGYCCYCMRRLSDGERVTFEHIIPQTADESVRGSYESAPNLSAAEVILTSEFSHKSDPVCPPYPHTVAYNNLVASCDGSFPDGTSALCCNHRRRDSFAYPVYYHADAGSRIKYLPDGSAIAVSQDSPQEIMIDHAGLNCRILRDIRYLWHQLRTLAEDDLNKCSANADYRRYTLHRPLFVSMDKLDAKLALIDKFTKDNYWAKLMSYKFFYEYFNGKDYSAGQ